MHARPSAICSSWGQADCTQSSSTCKSGRVLQTVCLTPTAAGCAGPGAHAGGLVGVELDCMLGKTKSAVCKDGPACAKRSPRVASAGRYVRTSADNITVCVCCLHAWHCVHDIRCCVAHVCILQMGCTQFGRYLQHASIAH